MNKTSLFLQCKLGLYTEYRPNYIIFYVPLILMAHTIILKMTNQYIALNKILNIWNMKHQGTYFFFDLPCCSWALKHQCLSQRNTYQTRPQ